jgi:hypothetical protein
MSSRQVEQACCVGDLGGVVTASRMTGATKDLKAAYERVNREQDPHRRFGRAGVKAATGHRARGGLLALRRQA